MTKKLSDRSLSYQMICSTVKLSVVYHGREDRGPTTGTGFFYDFGGKVTIITNRHLLVCDRKRVRAKTLTVHYSFLRDGERLQQDHEINVDSAFIACSDDKRIDLAAICVDDLINDLQNGRDGLDHFIMDKDVLPSDSFIDNMDAIEDVYMIGYPAGLIDDLNGLPIVRKGVTATPYALGYRDEEGGDDSFLLDIECVCGSSGSPVFSLRDGRLVLLGVNKQNRDEEIAVLGFLPPSKSEEADETKPQGEFAQESDEKKPYIRCKHPIHISVCTKSSSIPALGTILERGGTDMSQVCRMNTAEEFIAAHGVIAR